MRCRWIVVVLVGFGALVALGACHSAEPPVTPAAKGPTPCARASDSMVQTMLDRLSSKGPPPTEAADALRNLIRERCEQDRWSADAIRCLTAMASVEDAEACARLMTNDQQAALVRDETALFEPGHAPAGAPAERQAPAAKPAKPIE